MTLRQRLTNRVQLTSDGHKAYLDGVDYAFSGMNLDYAMLIKLYGSERPGEARYSPAECIGCKARAVIGNPVVKPPVRLRSTRPSDCLEERSLRQ